MAIIKTSTVVIKIRGSNPAIPFLHLPHGSDLRLRWREIPSVCHERYMEQKRLKEKAGEKPMEEVRISGAPPDFMRMLFLSGLKSIRRHIEGARIEGEDDTELQRSNQS